MVIKLKPNNFKLETNTIWSFKDRGNWATHNGSYRGNWSPYIPRNVILRYSKEGDTVLDQFVGSGTTLVESRLLKRKSIGIDINPEALDITKKNINFLEANNTIKLKLGDSRNLYFIKNQSIDLICTHPPYANIIKYSKSIDNDLSHLDIEEFCEEIL